MSFLHLLAFVFRRKTGLLIPYFNKAKDSKMLVILMIATWINSAESQLLNATFIPFVTGPLIDLPFQTKCYEGLGCFYNGPPWFSIPDRPLSFAPVDVFKTEFLLFTPSNIEEPYKMNLTEDTISDANINQNYPTKIIIHGYNVNVQPNDTRYRIKKALLEQGSFNVIIVDWSYNNQPPYPQAVANGRVVGAQVAKLINILQIIKNISLDHIHIIGHSLGAHIAGFAGKRLNGVSRITGLDPAGPYFQNAIPILRLDRTDAKFVDIIHTNAANNFIQGLGLEQMIGDIDYYPNGGNHQPGCLTNVEMLNSILAGFQYLIASSCDHSRAYEYFISSITDCDYSAVMCQNYLMYQSKMCTNFNSVISEMGYHAQKILGLKKHPKFYLRTTSSEPFCQKKDDFNMPTSTNKYSYLYFG
ncbi:pancreatic triacylglycerol lipase-like [Parasteatoda tepidariorum]|uniref:pancreatic triacylglycerol lipase-like n=1 Tax=Parasteatoda tepidariorum TaxID=114398 RepID=UPI00077FB6D6|nr:pancreatic triacylglycerol lipase-like [Parasteatoda tepidariorum]